MGSVARRVSACPKRKPGHFPAFLVDENRIPVALQALRVILARLGRQSAYIPAATCWPLQVERHLDHVSMIEIPPFTPQLLPPHISSPLS